MMWLRPLYPLMRKVANLEGATRFFMANEPCSCDPKTETCHEAAEAEVMTMIDVAFPGLYWSRKPVKLGKR